MIRGDHLQVAGKLSDVTIHVLPGEIVALVGSRGSGKSTLIRALAGVQPLTDGSASIDGLAVTDPACRARVGVVGEGWGLHERLTVAENLALFAGLWSVDRARVEELVRRLDLSGQMHRPVSRLTPGEVARLRLGRALLHSPAALLLDEPAGDVDGESESLIAFALEEEAEAGRAVLMATFGYPRTLAIASRTCYLEGGRLIQPEDEATATPAAAARAEATAAPPTVPANKPEAAALPRSSARIPHIAARKGERILLFRPDEIRMAYAQEKAVYIQTAEGNCAVSLTLTDLEERLADHGFFRCHRAYLVNVAWVKEIAAWTRDSFSLILKDGTEVPLSKHRAQELRVRLNW